MYVRVCVCGCVGAWVQGPNKVPKVSPCLDDDCVGSPAIRVLATQPASSKIREFGQVAEAS